jgi:hypothetical protein
MSCNTGEYLNEQISQVFTALSECNENLLFFSDDVDVISILGNSEK